ncbi:MAG: FecR family protein [Methylobacterium sp.]|uniref:FecR family protein n=1 Tax=Methylobacterium sp. TaxID=409 RepID=UPI0025D78AF4|nr:FecR family protein [Methylobacterium sp.]MBX9934895.1 FecR family protein [Methylobacterium sp.]
MTSFSRFAVAAILASGPALAAVPPASAADVVGQVDKVERQAVAVVEGQSRDMTVAGPVFFKDMIRTGGASRLESKLADGTVLTLGEHAKITVDEFVYRPDRQGGKLGLTVARGAFLFVGGKIEGPTGGNVAIRTAVGTLGVRGTTVWGGPIDGGFGVLVLDGLVTLKTARGSVTMRKGQGTMVYAGRAPQTAAPWPEDRTKRAVATISFSPKR